MMTVGKHARCPQCTRMGRIVWVSQNGETIGIQCSASHSLTNYPNSHGFKHSPSKENKNSVFLVKMKPLQP
jgi:hypothetical protein